MYYKHKSSLNNDLLNRMKGFSTMNQKLNSRVHGQTLKILRLSFVELLVKRPFITLCLEKSSSNRFRTKTLTMTSHISYSLCNCVLYKSLFLFSNDNFQYRNCLSYFFSQKYYFLSNIQKQIAFQITLLTQFKKDFRLIFTYAHIYDAN